ncbi:MAG: sensor histidine kinase [Rubrivivax sp.]|nr:sensor histidine kinase [Rubrivivax sp.]
MPRPEPAPELPPGRGHGPSLRSRLLRPLFWGWALGIVAAGLGALFLARSAASTAFDRGLQDEASALAAKVTWSDRGPLLDVSRQTLELLTWDSADRNAFAMFDIDGLALAGDAKVPFPPEEWRDASVARPTLFDGSFDGESVRGAVFTATSPMLDRRVHIVVVETRRRREDVVRDVQFATVLPMIALGVLTFLLLGRSVRRGLAPLRELGDEVARRELHDWTPLPLSSVPAEAVPMVERINALLGDVRQSVALQRRFVADAAHQLRTPVAGIRVLASEIERELGRPGNSGAAASTLLSELQRSTERLTRLIAQLLSLARSESELTLEAEQAVHDLTLLVRESTESLVLQALRSGRVVALEAPAEPVLARVHPVWLGEVIGNLLDNALRYGGPEIRIEIAPRSEGGAEIVVQDNGAGVAEADLPRLFEPFWRGTRADERVHDGGTGLGLAIAREIVERLGGSLQAQTRPQVEGMRFVIWLPG